MSLGFKNPITIQTGILRYRDQFKSSEKELVQMDRQTFLTPLRASDFLQDWWAEVTHGAKLDGSFSEMMGSSISN